MLSRPRTIIAATSPSSQAPPCSRKLLAEGRRRRGIAGLGGLVLQERNQGVGQRRDHEGQARQQQQEIERITRLAGS